MEDFKLPKINLQYPDTSINYPDLADPIGTVDSNPSDLTNTLDLLIEALCKLNATDWNSIQGDTYEGINWKETPSATKEQVEEKIKEIKQNKPINILRKQRDIKISETDWWVLPDRNPTPEQLAYRQALRDLPSNVTPVFNEDKTNITGFEWPEKPA